MRGYTTHRYTDFYDNCNAFLYTQFGNKFTQGVNGNFHIDEGINLENISLKKEKFESYGMRLSRSLS